MARKKETLLCRIARHTGHTEKSLTDFITSHDQRHLIWQGAMNPSRPLTRAYVPPHGRSETVNLVPQPVMRGGSPARLLFCYQNKIGMLTRGIQLVSKCDVPRCISPFHREMRATFSKRLGERIALPNLSDGGFDTDATEEDIAGLTAMLSGWPEIEAMPKEEILRTFDTYSPSEIAEAFGRLGWQLSP